MSSPDLQCPPLDELLDPSHLRVIAASFAGLASDDAVPVPPERRRECWRMYAALRLAALVIESGDARAGGHLAALELAVRGK